MRHNYYDIKTIFSQLEDSGFDGVLLAYAQKGDPFTVLANSINPESKMEYIVAVRPYLISPQYVSEIAKSFEDISPGKLSINVVPGNIVDSEINYRGVLGSVSDSSFQEDRRLYMGSWLKEYRSCRKTENRIYISGHHPDVIGYSEYSDFLIMNYYVYTTSHKDVYSPKPLYLSMSPVIGGNPKKTAVENVVTTPEGLTDVIKDLELSGVEGIFFHNTHSQQIYYLMEYVKKYKNL